MAQSSQPTEYSRSRRFDGSLLWRFAVAMASTAVALPLIASIIGAPIGIPLLLAGSRPLKNYFTKLENERVSSQMLVTKTRRKNLHQRGNDSRLRQGRALNRGDHPTLTA